MPKRKVSRSATVRKNDLSSWNFIIFLTLAFILLVVVVTMMKNVSQDVRSKAGLACPEVNLPRAEDCETGWVFKRDATNGCLAFFCSASPSAAPTK